MKKVVLVVFVLALTNGAMAQAPWENGKLLVSDNGRYLQHANGRAFFWLGDTAWLLFQKMDRDENTGSVSFNPPGEKANGNDGVLVLDDAAKKFKAPGVGIVR